MKEKIKEIVLSYGANLCGVAHVDRFNNAPLGFKPTDIYPDCKSVISFAIVLPQGMINVDSRFIYEHYFYQVSCPEAENIAFKSAKKIEELFAAIAVPMPCNNAYEYFDVENKIGKGLISLRHAAELAGLGFLGKNTLLITKQYGNMVTLGAILTNLELPSDELDDSTCLAGCNKCLEVCAVQALGNDTVIQKKCREYAYGMSKRGFETIECNKCRIVCPLNK